MPLALLSLTACPKPGLIEDVRPYAPELRQTTEAFLNGFFALDLTQTMGASTTPFFLDRKAVIGYSEEWAAVLSNLFRENKRTSWKLTGWRALTAPEASLLIADYWNVLQSSQFHEKIYALAEIEVASSPPYQERILLIFDRPNPQSPWKVVGFVR